MIILSTLGAGNNEANAIEATPLVVLKKNVTNGGCRKWNHQH